MTGNIEEILLSSVAVNSLQLESRVAQIFRRHSWDAERGVYYLDPATEKPREIDVYVGKVLNNPQRRKGFGAPLINLHIFCECKTLKGYNVVFSPDDPPKWGLSPMSYWAGTEDRLEKVIESISNDVGGLSTERCRELYGYLISRAYFGEGLALSRVVSMPPPQVDLFSKAFRETKNGGNEKENNLSSSQEKPLWSAIRSCLSAMAAARIRAQDASLSRIHTLKFKFYDADIFIDNLSISFDSEMLRTVFFHPFIVSSARLWALKEGSLKEIKSARLFLSDINFKHDYVDIVNENAIEDYIENLITHYSKVSRKSITNFWQLIDDLEWCPGEQKNKLGIMLGIHPDIKITAI